MFPPTHAPPLKSANMSHNVPNNNFKESSQTNAISIEISKNQLKSRGQTLRSKNQTIKSAAGFNFDDFTNFEGSNHTKSRTATKLDIPKTLPNSNKKNIPSKASFGDFQDFANSKSHSKSKSGLGLTDFQDFEDSKISKNKSGLKLGDFNDFEESKMSRAGKNESQAKFWDNSQMKSPEPLDENAFEDYNSNSEIRQNNANGGISSVVKKQKTIDDINLFESVEKSKDQGKAPGSGSKPRHLGHEQQIGKTDPTPFNEYAQSSNTQIGFGDNVFSKKRQPNTITTNQQTQPNPNSNIGLNLAAPGVAVMFPTPQSKSIENVSPSMAKLSLKKSHENSQQIVLLQNEIHVLKTENNQLKEERKTIIDSLQVQENEIAILTKQNHQSQEEILRLKTIIEHTGKQNVAESGKRESLWKTKFEIVRASFQSMKGELESLKDTLKTQIGSTKTDFTRQQQIQRNSHKKDIERFTYEIEKRNAQLRGSEKVRKELDEKIRTLRAENLKSLWSGKDHETGAKSRDEAILKELKKVLGELGSLKVQKEKLKSQLAVTKKWVERETQALIQESQQRRAESQRDKTTMKQTINDLKAQNAELGRAVEDWTGNGQSLTLHSKSNKDPLANNESGSLVNQVIQQNKLLEKKKRIDELEKEVDLLSTDLEVYQGENKKLLKRIVDEQAKMAEIETKYDIHHIDAKLETYENENQELNQKNLNLLEEVFKVKENLLKTSKALGAKGSSRQEFERLSTENSGMKGQIKDLKEQLKIISQRAAAGEVSRHEPNEYQDYFRQKQNETYLTVMAKDPFVSKSAKNKIWQNSDALSGQAFLDRFDVLMQLNNATKKDADIGFNQLLDPISLAQKIYIKDKASVKKYFRGMIEDHAQIYHSNRVAISLQSFYRIHPTEFEVFYQLKISNTGKEAIFLMGPQIKSLASLEIIEGPSAQGNIEVSPNESIRLSVRLRILQMDLPLGLPALFCFFLFTRSEFSALVSKKVRPQFHSFWKKVPLPFNICKFLKFPKIVDFSVLSSLTMTEEMMVSNAEVQLDDLKIIFPNLEILGFDKLDILLDYHDDIYTTSIDDLLNGAVNLKDKNLICFGSKIQTYLGNMYVILEFSLVDYSFLVKLFSISTNDLAVSLMFYIRAILHNI